MILLIGILIYILTFCLIDFAVKYLFICYIYILLLLTSLFTCLVGMHTIFM